MRLRYVAAMGLCVACGTSSPTNDGGTDGSAGEAGGACSFNQAQVSCQDSVYPDSGLQIVCDTSSCCACVDHGTTVKACTSGVQCGGPVSCCSRTAASCCGF